MRKQKIKFKIGVMGSAGRGKKLPQDILKKAKKTGEEIAKSDCILVTGACMGVPDEVAKGASREKGNVIAFSPVNNLKEHLNPPISYPKPTPGTFLIFTGFGMEGRNVLLVKNCDAAIFIRGSIGTLTEFSLAYHMGKVIGVLENTGGIAEKIPEIANAIKKNTGAVLIFDSDPKNLVKKIINTLKQKNKKSN